MADETPSLSLVYAGQLGRLTASVEVALRDFRIWNGNPAQQKEAMDRLERDLEAVKKACKDADKTVFPEA